MEISLDYIKVKVTPILKQYGVRTAAIFGSFARGEEENGSDIDMLVDVKGIGAFSFVRLQLDLQDAIGKKVDLVDYRAIKPFLRKRILKEQKVIYEGKRH
ncbi:nucleotidyltransferase family protein [candidate division WOR-3 bacterium]|nr:nucleotidyltransferase family protein [candidate division WOR-3 bacterium]